MNIWHFKITCALILALAGTWNSLSAGTTFFCAIAAVDPTTPTTCTACTQYSQWKYFVPMGPPGSGQGYVTTTNLYQRCTNTRTNLVCYAHSHPGPSTPRCETGQASCSTGNSAGSYTNSACSVSAPFEWQHPGSGFPLPSCTGTHFAAQNLTSVSGVNCSSQPPVNYSN